MAVVDVQFYSPALNKQVNYAVLLPDVGEGPFPVLLQLHGLTDNHRSWIQQSSLTRHASGYPMIVVMPDGGTSGYVNWPAPERLGRQDYEDLLIHDLRAHIHRHFNARPGKWAIGGLSMGGYGAMRLGLKYPDCFCSIWSHSSAFHIGDFLDERFVADPDDCNVALFADRVVTMPPGERPAIAFDCGTEDDLLPHNRDLDAHMTAIGLEHIYKEHPGGHTWEYWDTHVREALASHAGHLGVTRVVK